jgi:hypothetical protein
MKCAAILLGLDVLVALLPFSAWIESSQIGVIGDLLLVEIAVLFIVGGIFEIGSSAGMMGFRKLFSPNMEYSASKRKEAERRAMVFLVAGFLLLVVMITLATYDLSIANLWHV